MAGYFSAALILGALVSAASSQEEVAITPKPKNIISGKFDLSVHRKIPRVQSKPLTLQISDVSNNDGIEHQSRLLRDPLNQLGVYPYDRLAFDPYNRLAFTPYYNHAVGPTIYGPYFGRHEFGFNPQFYGINGIFDDGSSYDKNWYPGALPPLY